MWANYMMGNSWWVMGPYMGLFWLLVLAAIVALVLSMTHWHRSDPARVCPPAETARTILEERYARGDIDKDEFEQKKRDLRS